MAKNEFPIRYVRLKVGVYLRLVRSPSGEQNWIGRDHFFAAAAEDMRRHLIYNTRRRDADKHGAGSNASNCSTPS